MTAASDGAESERPDALPDAMIEAAAVWHARLREPEPNPAAKKSRQMRFEQWLAADARHPLAYAEARRLWNVLEAPAAGVLAEERISANAAPLKPRPLPPAWQAAALAACLLLVCAGVLWRAGYLDDLRSDYVTAVGERSRILLGDGSQIVLNTDSAMAVELTLDSRRIRFFRGEAWFDVASDPARPFTVDTPSGTVRVTGTRFNVRIEDGGVWVGLAEGRITLRPNDASDTGSVALAPGQRAQLSGSGVSRRAQFDMAAVTAWMHGQIVFYDAPLARVVDELNRYRSGRIVILDDELESLRVSGVFQTDDADAALAAIAATLPVHITRIGGYLVLLR